MSKANSLVCGGLKSRRVTVAAWLVLPICAYDLPKSNRPEHQIIENMVFLSVRNDSVKISEKSGLGFSRPVRVRDLRSAAKPEGATRVKFELPSSCASAGSATYKFV